MFAISCNPKSFVISLTLDVLLATPTIMNPAMIEKSILTVSGAKSPISQPDILH